MSAYRDPVFDAVAGLERKKGCPLAFLQEAEAAKQAEIQEKPSGKTVGAFVALSKKY